MTTKDDLTQQRKSRVSRTQSLFTDSFKMGASLLQNMGGNGKSIKHLNLQNVKLIDKRQYQQKQICFLCFVPFNKINRRHHCRICAKSCCGDCSNSTINKQRACDKCIYQYLQPQKQLIKEGLLERLKINALEYIQARMFLDEQLKKVELDLPNPQEIQDQKNQNQQRLTKLESQLQQKRKMREQLEKQIQAFKMK